MGSIDPQRYIIFYKKREGIEKNSSDEFIKKIQKLSSYKITTFGGLKTKIMQRRLLVLMMFATGLLSLQAGEGVYRFLTLPVSSYAAGLGGTVLSSPENDLNLSLHNPAALSGEMHNQLSLGYMNYLADIHLGTAAYARRINERSSWMAALRYVDYGRMIRAGDNLPEGEFFAKDMAMSGAYAFMLSPRWRAGANMHLVYSVLDQYTSLGMAIDLGLYYTNPEQKFCAGFAVKNLGTQFKPYDESYEALPWDVQFGITKGLLHAPFRFTFTAWGFNAWSYPYMDGTTGLTVNNDNFVEKVFKHLLIGLEFVPSDNFQLSLGYNVRRKSELSLAQRTILTGFSAGFSMSVRKLRIGASFAQYHIAGNSLQMTLSTDLGIF